MVNSLPDVYEGEDFINFRRDVELSKDPTKAAQGYFNNPAYMTNTELAAWMGNSKGDPTKEYLTRLELTSTEVANYLAGRTVDWRDVIYQDVALRQDYTVSVAGKKDEMSYYSSVNYLKMKVTFAVQAIVPFVPVLTLRTKYSLSSPMV